MQLDHIKLKRWFLETKRDLPWRQEPTPYAVWISEVMLQQTQVAVVIPYFLRWMEKFPTIEVLAKAKVEDVIKEWEGLGYYSRARSLHHGANQVMQQWGGVLPKGEDELATIKGLGPYTIGAIRSFAFHMRTSAVDGNVIRVLTRYWDMHLDVCKPKTVQEIRKMADSVLPEKESWVTNEALIELGATICTKKPNCGLCPIRESCQGYKNGTAEMLPVKSKSIKIEALFRSVAILECQGSILVSKGASGKIMADLHEFPYIETGKDGIAFKSFEKELKNKLNLSAKYCGSLPETAQSFTRYRVKLQPMQFTVEERREVEGYFWVKQGDLKKLPFSSGHKRILQMLE
jgi:A/G-specific adenine glycosylase